MRDNPIRFKGINHLAFATWDMDATIRYWRDLLGLRLIAGLGDRRYRHYFFELSETDMIAFFEWPDVESIPEKDHGVPVKGPFCFDHVSLEVADADMLWALKDRIDAAGFWVSEVMNHGFIHSVYSFDPNHIPIEFSVPVKTLDLRKTPRMRDRHPSKVAQEGPEPVPGCWPAVAFPTPASERDIFPGEGMVLWELSDNNDEI
jgi:catechol 2,3-dioxygenase-like lactoylglutathione lyase family enzyme